MKSDISQRSAITILGVTWFVFGFVTWLNGPLISFAKLAFSLSDVEAFFVPLVFYMSYFVFALPAAAVLRRIGMKRGMAVGLVVMAIGTAAVGQFAAMRVFSGMLGGLFVLGSGLALLQTAANPYISILGPIEGAAQRIAIVGICNKAAGILAPVAFGLLIMQGVSDLAKTVAAADPSQRDALLQEFSARVHLPYLVMAAVLLAFAVGMLKSPLPELKPDTDKAVTASDTRKLTTFPNLWFGIVCLFLYMGAEVMAGDAIGTYGQAFGLPFGQTAYFTALTLAAMLVGYVCGFVVIPRFASQQRYLAFSAICGLLATIGAYATRDYISVGFVAALGFANAMMWPAIFPLSIRGLGRRHIETGSAILIMAISGGALIPQLFALIKHAMDFQLAFFILMAPIYCYIWYFAVSGYRLRDERGAPTAPTPRLAQ